MAQDCLQSNYNILKAAVLYQSGGPENFVIEERSVLSPIEGQVLIKVKAFGLNRSELMTRKGLSPNVIFPRVLGIECVGEVEKDPSGEFQKGQKVAAIMGGMGRDFDGSYAEYTVVPKKIVSAFESKLPWEILGALPEMFQTAYGSLFLALKVQREDTLLIRGGTSSVGMLAIQLAKKEDIKVFATTRTPGKKEILMKNRADKILIDDGNLSEKIKNNKLKINKVLELVGTNTLPDSLKCVVPGGAVCMTGMLSENWEFERFAPMDYIPSTVSLTIYDSGQTKVGADAFQRFLNDIQNGSVRTIKRHVFSLTQIADAHRLMENNDVNGKIVVLT